MILSENPELRGNDYLDKDVYEQKAEIELGYESGYKVMTEAEKYELFG